jgi:hypothetical protein
MKTIQTCPTRIDLLGSVLPEDAKCAEIGVLRGDFSEEIIARAHPKKLWLVDIWQDGPQWEYESNQDNMMHVWWRFQRQIKGGWVDLIRKPSAEAAAMFRDQTLDWVYIDAAHDLENVRRDIRAWLPKVPVNTGILAFHDYVKEHEFDVIQAVKEAEGEGLLEVFCITQEKPGDLPEPRPTAVAYRRK